MRTVLIFDSSAVTCHTVSKQLRTYGFDTIQARSIVSARAALASKRVDLVILDFAPLNGGAPLPSGGSDASGMALLRELRQSREAGAGAGQQPSVIILTSSARDSDRIAARAAGAMAFLTKPASTRELLLTVNSALATAVALHGPAQPSALAAQVAATRQIVAASLSVHAGNSVAGTSARSILRHAEGMHP